MSIAVRNPLLRSVIWLAESVALTASFIANIVVPRMMVVIAIATSSSTSVKPRSERPRSVASRLP